MPLLKIQRSLAVILIGGLLTACAPLKPAAIAPADSPAAKKLAIRNNAASLLYDLLGDEKNVSKVLAIKHHSEELGRLIQTISTAAGEKQQQLERLAKEDPNLNLHDLGLPPGEMAAREGTGKSKEYDLLFTFDQTFEFNLLMTQAEALNYGWHLAKVAADNSVLPEEVEKFNAISRQMENLYRQVFKQMHPD
jgi:hypothetical protein